tara:strand:- start:1114 stop:1617 length:504 start_codon:yes stop_codon:yes gene_type:complete
MKLTEAKLKQMILEALKKKNFQDFGIPTPDYPRDLKQETIQSFMESHGFDLEIQELEYAGHKLEIDRLTDVFMNEVYIHSDSSKSFSIDYGIETHASLPNKKYIYFNYSYLSNLKATRKKGTIEIPSMFDLDMGNYYYPNEENIEVMSSLIIGKIKDSLKKIIGIKK